MISKTNEQALVSSIEKKLIGTWIEKIINEYFKEIRS